MPQTITFRYAVILLLTISLGFTLSCQQELSGPVVVNPAFGEYVAAYTSGEIPRRSNIHVRLNHAPLEGPEAGQAVPKNWFQIEPRVEGNATWVDDRTIAFQPIQPLTSGETYTVDFKLGNAIAVPDSFDLFRFQFRTIEQAMHVEVGTMVPYRNDKMEWQQLTGVLHTADYIDSTAVSKLLAATQGRDENPLKVSWTTLSENSFAFTVDSISRKKSAGFMQLQWKGEAIGLTQTGEERVEIPALGDFSIADVSVYHQPEQYLELHFSDPIKATQNLEGIIRLSGVEDLTYSVEGNKVSVFPPYRLSGLHTLSITKGIRNHLGYRMSDAEEREVQFELLKPDLRLVGSGNILPNSQGLYFPFEAVSLSSVDVEVTKVFSENIVQFFQANDLEGSYQMSRVGKRIHTKTVRLDSDPKTNLTQWNRFNLDLSDLVSAEPGAIYQVRLKYNRSHSAYPCEAGEDVPAIDAEPLPAMASDGWTEKDWQDYYNDYDYWYDDDYDYRERENPCNPAYYRYRHVSRNILASDLGIVAKAGGDKRMHIMVNNLLTTEAMPGAIVEFYDYQQQVIGSVKTDANGMADLHLSEKPFVAIARYQGQHGYLRLRDGDALSMSKFDVSGESVQKGIKGYIYGERGVWRPGDSIYVSFMLEDKTNLLPPAHPVHFELVNPQGQVIEKRMVTDHVNHVYDFRTATDPDAPTGNYSARVKVGNRTFTERLRVETVKPNRLKIYLDFGKEQLDFADAKAEANLEVKWLHGATARNLQSKVEVRMQSMRTNFKKFPDYSFDDVTRNYDVDEEVVFDGAVNEEGVATFETSLGGSNVAPGMLRAHFTTRVFEEGGGFSIDRMSIPYSPYDHYAGISVPEGNLYRGTLVTDQDHYLGVASVDAQGNPAAREVEVKIYKLSWRWWWDRHDEDVSSYLSRTGATPVKTQKITTSSRGRAKVKVRVDQPEWGRYVAFVHDHESGHVASKIFFIDWPYWARANRTNNEYATMLSFSADKEDYTVGETMKISFPSSDEGHALICVESGTQVLSKYLIDTQKGETKFEIPVNKEMAPNVYVHVALLQPHARTANDLPIRMYGVLPIGVEDPSTRLKPVVALPEVLRPESTVNVNVQEQEGRRMTYTLALVDEGLLDLTRFSTPDPWKKFYAKEALGVRTWDMYDDVIGAWSGEVERVLSIGGDGANQTNNAARANRFKPMVKFLGPFELPAGQEHNHKIEIPNYVGSVRVMVVAAQDGSYGHTETAVPVRNPLMVLASLPRVLGPTETVKLPINVFAMEKHVKDVSIEIVPNQFLKSKGPLKQTIRFDKTGDQVVNFELEVANMVGIGKVKVIARAGKERATHEIELDVRTPNPRSTDVLEVVLGPGESWSPEVAFRGVAGTNSAVMEVSAIPPVDLSRRMNYLIRYPHGCIEQTTSSVFPQLYVNNITPLSSERRQEVATNIKAGLQRLLLFQTAQGGFGYWPGREDDNAWGTNYGGHFMLEAERAGYRVPKDLRRKWVDFQKDRSRSYRTETGQSNFHGDVHYNDLTQAYRLYTLALAKAPEMGAMNRLRETKSLSLPARWRLAAAYQLVGQPEVARDLVYGFETNISPYVELSGNYGSGTRDEAMILETLTIMKDRSKAGTLAVRIAEAMNDQSHWMSTQTTAYCLLGLSRFMGKQKDTKVMEFTWSSSSTPARRKKIQAPVYQMEFAEEDMPTGGTISFTNNGANQLYVKLTTEGVPATGDPSDAASHLQMEVSYTDMGGRSIKVEELEQGTDFVAVVTLRNPGTKGNLREMALNQVFPSGWEIHNSRMDDGATTLVSSPSDYQDIRDDRVYTYYSLNRGDRKTFRIKLNATYLGRFYLPSVTSDAMYDNTIHARQHGRWVEVVPAGSNNVSTN